MLTARSCARPQVLISLLCSWIAAQIGPVQMRLADALQVFCGAGLASTGIITCAVLGWERLSTHPVLLEALADGKSGGALFFRHRPTSCSCV